MPSNLRDFLAFVVSAPSWRHPRLMASASKTSRALLPVAGIPPLTFGTAWRMEKRNPNLIGTINGGTKYSVNGDDGNLNFDRGHFQ